MKINKFECVVIGYSQKIHMIAFNLVSLDTLFYGIRTVFHSKGLSSWLYTKNFILLTLLIIDFCEIWTLGSSVLLEEIESKVD